MKFRCRWALLAGVSWLGLRAAANDDEPPPPVWPTTTVAGGDTGGKFFGHAPDERKTRHYYIAAEAVPWDFVPAGRDEVCGLTLPAAVLANHTRTKLRYIQYTDASFAARAIAPESLGILGPVLRGVVGEYLAVTFLNRTGQPLSMHPHGVHYDKDSEGAYYLPGPGRGAAVAPGAKFTYVWQLDESAGPLPGEPSSKAWLYHSHVLGDSETNLGLIGCIIVTDPKRARADGTPADVDREFATLFMIFDESGPDLTPVASAGAKSPPAGATAAPGAGAKAPVSWAQAQELAQAGERYAINGQAFGNLHGLEMNEGERTRWYLFALGSETDFHTAHWHGLRVIEEGRRRTDVVDLLPATMKVADLVADNPGEWLFHCHVAEHMQEGMFARLTVYARDTVGVSRAPDTAFLGVPAALASLRIESAEAVLNMAATPVRADVVIDGVVTVPEAFDVTSQGWQVQFGERQVALHANRDGIGKARHAMLRILNSDDDGIVDGGVLEFELVFDGPDWLEGVPRVAPGANRPVDLAIAIGPTRHAAVAEIVPRVNRK
jgi:multicopper oxidase